MFLSPMDVSMFETILKHQAALIEKQDDSISLLKQCIDDQQKMIANCELMIEHLEDEISDLREEVRELKSNS